MRQALTLVALLLGVTGASAADRWEKPTGGLALLPRFGASVEAVELYIAPDTVRITYRIHNSAPEPEQLSITFPMPDVDGELFGDPDLAAAIPAQFKLTRDGVPVNGTLHQFVTALGVDRTDVVRELHLPLNPADVVMLDVPGTFHPGPEGPVLSEADQERLERLGMIEGWVLEASEDGTPPPTYSAMWTLHSSFTLEDTLGPGQRAEYALSYPPASRTEQFAEGVDLSTYCLTREMVARARAAAPPETWFRESSAILDFSGEFQFQGPVDEFHLVLDGAAANRVAMACWPEPLKQTGPMRYEAVEGGDRVYLPTELRVVFVEPQPQ